MKLNNEKFNECIKLTAKKLGIEPNQFENVNLGKLELKGVTYCLVPENLVHIREKIWYESISLYLEKYGDVPK